MGNVATIEVQGSSAEQRRILIGYGYTLERLDKEDKYINVLCDDNNVDELMEILDEMNLEGRLV